MHDSEICSLNRISDAVKGPAIIYISIDAGGNEASSIYESVKSKAGETFSFYELIVKNWDDYLTPWPMQMGKRNFEGKADTLLSIIESETIPIIESEIGLSEDVFIAGYSLGGLFSLWSLYESNIFSGAVSCSGSLWYKGWTEYIREKELSRNAKIYLSLGDKEKNTKNSYMKLVEDNTIYQKEVFESSKEVIGICYEVNNGGHFSDVVGRMTKGISWILE